MTGIAATPDSAASRFGRRFGRIVLIGSVVFLLAGIAGFSYLRINSSLALLGGSDRPIAAASAFVPAESPFTVSLLIEPERLVALSQAVVHPDQRSQARSEIEQVQQHFQQITGLSYERDIQPWLGQEITFACTEMDLDRDLENGQQPGYLSIFEIAPGRYEQAQSFLQLFWQRQAIAGKLPAYQTVSGVKILASQDAQVASLTAASALVGRQFVMFANDERVLRSSIRAAQTAQNLAQSPAYRQRVAALPDQRVALAYLDARLLRAAKPLVPMPVVPIPDAAQFIAVSLEAKRDGLMAIAQLPKPKPLSGGPKTQTNSLGSRVESLWDSKLTNYLPADSELAVIGKDISELSAAWAIAGLPDSLLPKFMRLQPSSAASFANSLSDPLYDPLYEDFNQGYALSRVSYGPSPDWILAVPREAAQVAALDQAAMAAGYSVVPVTMDTEGEATAWTRFTAQGGKRTAATTTNSPRSNIRSGLESELLGLHLQQGNIEIFASSLTAMDSALESQTSDSSLSASPQFVRVTSPLMTARSDAYVYLSWPKIAPIAGQLFPMLNQVQAVASPLTNHIDAIAASHDEETVRLFIQLVE
ncbi:MAG: DUF3352 domain-containing protein [Phormidesmis sp.]